MKTATSYQCDGCLSTPRILILPYFLPPRELIGALVSAALRGVEVSIILPERSNLPYVHWATRNMLWELLRWGINVYYQPLPFNHSTIQPFNHSTIQPFNHSTIQPFNHSTIQPFNHSTIPNYSSLMMITPR